MFLPLLATLAVSPEPVRVAVLSASIQSENSDLEKVAARCRLEPVELPFDFAKWTADALLHAGETITAPDAAILERLGVGVVNLEAEGDLEQAILVATGFDETTQSTLHRETRDQALLLFLEEYRDGEDRWPLEYVAHIARLAKEGRAPMARAEFLLERGFHATAEAPNARIFLLREMAHLGSPAFTDVAAHNIRHEVYGDGARRILEAVGGPRAQEILFQALISLPNERLEPIILALGKVRAANAVLALGDMLANGDPELAPAVMRALLDIDNRASMRALQRIDIPRGMESTRDRMYLQIARERVEAGSTGGAEELLRMAMRSSSVEVRVDAFEMLASLPDVSRPSLLLRALGDEGLRLRALEMVADLTPEEMEAVPAAFAEINDAGKAVALRELAGHTVGSKLASQLIEDPGSSDALKEQARRVLGIAE